jgi:hypothetical protein
MHISARVGVFCHNCVSAGVAVGIGIVVIVVVDIFV